MNAKSIFEAAMEVDDFPVKKTILIDGKERTLEIASTFWEGLEEISRREGWSISELCETVEKRSRWKLTLPRAIESFVTNYFRSPLEAKEARI